MQIHIKVTIRGISEKIPTYGRSSPSKPLMAGNGFYIAPNIADWGMVNMKFMRLLKTHKISNMI